MSETSPKSYSDEQLRAAAAWMADRLPPMQSSLRDIDASQPIPGMHVPRLEAFTALDVARQQGIQSGYIHLVTGMGKAAVQLGDFLRFREEASAAAGRVLPRGLHVAPTTWGYAVQMARHYAPNLTAQFYKPNLTSMSTDLVVSGLSVLMKNRENLDPATFDYIMYDDVTADRLREYQQLVSYFKPQFQVGYTADSRVRDQDMQSIFGEQLYSISNVLEPDLPAVHTISTDEAVSRGLIGPNYKLQ